MEKVTLVVPTIAKDIPKLLNNIDVYFSLLPIKNICVVATSEVGEMLPLDERILFISEDELVSFGKVKELIERRSGQGASKRTGWYVQQFIKLAYSRVTDDEYYLLWDSDTIPVKEISLFNNKGLPYLDCKTEYHKPYFDTISRLLPDHKKEYKGSFVAEHMLIKTDAMREMLSRIETNSTIQGDNFIEKVINAVDTAELSESGFSEFETYGTFVYRNHREMYELREWHSMRFGGFFYNGSSSLSDEVMTWLSKKYDAISFEKGDSISSVSKIVQSKQYMKIFKASSLHTFAFAIRAYRKITKKR